MNKETKEYIENRHRQQKHLYKKSGRVSTKDPLVQFLYGLMKEFPPGKVQDLILDTVPERCLMTNGWLAKYSIYLAKQIRAKSGK